MMRSFGAARMAGLPAQARPSSVSLGGFFSQEKPPDFTSVRRERLQRQPVPQAVTLPSPSKDSWVVIQEKQKEDARLVLQRHLKGLLNKLTIEKFDRIYQQILSAGIKVEEEVKCLMRMVFEKAVAQHHFIQMYVMLCGKLKLDFQELLEDDHRNTKFRRILIDQCEDSFNANLEPISVPKDLNADDAYEFELNYKKTMTGNMIFVGELLKSKMISQAILLECIDRLLQKREECIASSNGEDQGVHHVEALCAFLHTVGPFFDNPQCLVRETKAGEIGGGVEGKKNSQLGRMRQERDRDRRAHGGDSRRSVLSDSRRVIVSMDDKKKKKFDKSSSAGAGGSSSSSGVGGLLDVEGARAAARREFSDLICSTVEEGIEVFSGIQCDGPEAQQALLLELLLVAADKLVSDKESQKQQRQTLFQFLVALASTDAFPPDTLKFGLRDFMGLNEEGEGLYKDLLLDAPHLPNFMREFLDVVEAKDPDRRLLSTAALDDLREPDGQRAEQVFTSDPSPPLPPRKQVREFKRVAFVECWDALQRVCPIQVICEATPSHRAPPSLRGEGPPQGGREGLREVSDLPCLRILDVCLLSTRVDNCRDVP
ncbi:mif4g domain-containing protein [Cyclospora cayetanensis]|uniref:Mif4g domain-containing protein n=1 Tax=Cyclospora cayetanensis TaxID=88456 RepID=A0A1D3CZG2_9EIME|nr:mif4g domain-containing protein [Cyclospora cayetanensis]